MDARRLFIKIATFSIALGCASVLASCCEAAHGNESAAVTLDQALELAKQNNAELPVARLRSQIAGQTVARSRGKLGPRVYFSSNLPYSPPTLGYSPGATPNEASVLLNAEQPLYAGDTLRAQLNADQYNLDAAEASYRVSERDVELSVRSRFYEILYYDARLTIEREGIERLRSYLKMIRLRKASGQGVNSDYLKTQVRIDEQQAQLTAAERGRGEARIEFNVLLGHDPSDPVVLVPLPEPKSLPEILQENVSLVPDFAVAQAERSALDAQISVASGKVCPHLSLFANTGLIDPGLGVSNSTSSLDQRLRGDLGVAVGINLTWNIWNFGAYQAEIALARLTAERAAASVVAVRRKNGLEYERALVDAKLWFAEYQIRSHQAPLSRDSYLASESLYRGGQDTALNVIDAFAAFVSAQTNQAQALYEFRRAYAKLLRRSGES